MIAQQSPQNLSTGALGNNLDKLDSTLEPLVSRFVFFDMLVNARRNLLVRLALGPFGLDDKGLGYLSSSLVGDLDDGAV